jgi:hypothetical protein
VSPDEVAALQGRVANGLVWLDEHDPLSRFHLWWESGLTPSSPMPAQEKDEATMAAWREYFERRRLWERLSNRLEAVDPKWARVAPGGEIQWQGKRPR